MSKRSTLSRSSFAHGDYNVICANCAAKKKRSEVVRQDNGMLVCPNEVEITISRSGKFREHVKSAGILARPDNDIFRDGFQTWDTISGPDNWEDQDYNWNAG